MERETDDRAPTSAPLIVVLAGPNGAGKTSIAPDLLQGAYAVDEYVNADAIAMGLSGFRPDSVAIAAGRVMLSRLDALADARRDFAFETTLAARSFGPWLRARRGSGYRVHLTFLGLPDADTAVNRVADRVRRGGHAIPEPTIRRRYVAGLQNFHRVYREIVDSWLLIDNGSATGPIHVAAQDPGRALVILDAQRWQRMERFR